MAQLRNWRYAALIIILVLLAWLVMDFNSRMAKLNSLNQEREYVMSRYERVVATKSALETEVAQAGSDAAAREWAYEQGHMVLPGEIAVIPFPGEEVITTPTLAPAATQPAASNVESWIALFLGP
jgi:cell division protein FtsB